MEDILRYLVLGIMIGGLYALISIGLTLIFGIIKIVNFAHGEFLMVSMFATWLLHLYTGLDPYILIFIVVPLMFVFGMLAHKLTTGPVLGTSALQHILVTVGLMFFLQNTALFLFGADNRTVRTELSRMVYRTELFNISLTRGVTFLVAIALALGVYFFLNKTYLGKAIRAVSMDRLGAYYVGIDIDKIYTIAFGLGIALVGAAGAMMIHNYYANPMIGLDFEVTAFVVVILGGFGSLIGSLVGGLLIGIIEVFSGIYIAPALAKAIYFVIFIAVIAIKPSGLFGIGGGYEEVGM